MDKRAAFFLWGLFFLLVMEFQFQVQITGNPIGFLLTPLVEIPFLLVAFYTGQKLDSLLEKSRFKELVVFVASGILGLLVIEWAFVGNTPAKLPGAVYQFAMFSYWGGSVLFARILTSEDSMLVELKTWMLRYFGGYSIMAIVGGFFIPAGMRHDLVILLAMAGYGLMNAFYAWFFFIRFRPKSASSNSGNYSPP